MSKVDELKALVAKFEAAQKKHAKLGAQDTEPDGKFQWLLVRAFKGKDPKVPETPEGWELYVWERGELAAAHALWSKARDCCEFIKSVPLGEAAAVKGYLESYCWRVSF